MAVTLHYWNLDGQEDVDGYPVQFGGCPLCGHPMLRGEELKLVEADNCMGLAHADCCIAADEEK